MGDIYVYMLVILAGLAITDLVVGVSNDAVNFLNSAIGSKAISFKSIMIIASIGIAVGALSSSGMMEVARKGIFNPEMFFFDEVMMIFMAVMITDILLLDFFNSLGLPTSTTVSIVFELLGAAVCIALIKIYYEGDTETIADLGNYINSKKALMIIAGILGSVVIAFTTGAIAQFFSRMLLTFNFEKRAPIYASLFGGISLVGLFYFIIIKGLSKTDISLVQNTSAYLEQHMGLSFLVGFVVLSALSYLYIILIKKSIYILIIALGTFGLAMAFAGNDLVNFIGVVIGAKQAWAGWVDSGLAATDFNMASLAAAQKSPYWILLAAGGIMVLTLWFSSKAQAVVKTSVDLARQGNGTERFAPNAFSRFLVRYTIITANFAQRLLPQSTANYISARFEKRPEPAVALDPSEQPAFDYVRAAVNLMIASILISVATTYLTLPLSTTYVTFMVAMGTSLADRAWGSESAVYRIAGVLNVIGGWFFTAFSAFTAAAIFASIIYYGGFTAIVGLVLLAVFLLLRNYLSHKKKKTATTDPKSLKNHESSTVQGIINESANNVSNVVSRTNKIYTDVLHGLAKEDKKSLKKSKKGVEKLDLEIESLRDNIFYFIKNLDETSLRGSNFYITILAHLTDIAQSLEFITTKSYKHINNEHRKLRYNQFKDLQEVNDSLSSLLNEIEEVFQSRKFERIDRVLSRKEEILGLLSTKIQAQISRTRSEESSPKNTTLYFNILLETKDLVTGIMDLMQEYYSSYKRE